MTIESLIESCINQDHILNCTRFLRENFVEITNGLVESMWDQVLIDDNHLGWELKFSNSTVTARKHVASSSMVLTIGSALTTNSITYTWDSDGGFLSSDLLGMIDPDVFVLVTATGVDDLRHTYHKDTEEYHGDAEVIELLAKSNEKLREEVKALRKNIAEYKSIAIVSARLVRLIRSEYPYTLEFLDSEFKLLLKGEYPNDRC